MKLPSFSHLFEAVKAAFSRFPLVMLVAIVGTINLMIMIESGGDEDITTNIRLALTCFLALPMLITAKIFAENQDLKGFLKWLPSFGGLALLSIYFATLDITEQREDYIDIFRFFGLNIALHLMVAFVAYMDRSTIADFWEYNKLLFVNFLVGAFYSIVIFAGLSAAIVAVDQLFNLDIDGKIYGHLFFLIAGLFNTTYFLFHFPKKYDGLISEASDTQNTKAIRNLTKFILIPLVGIYFLILYAYGFKILIQWDLPEGWVSSLTIGFSVVGIFTYLLNYMLTRFEEGKLVQRYRKNFFYTLLPLVVLLFVAIGRRIGDYGITEERYIVLALGIWLLFLSLYFIISKIDNIKVIPMSLAVVALITVLSPFSAFQISKKSQVKRFLTFAEEHQILQDGKLVPMTEKLEHDAYWNGRSMLRYLAERSHLTVLQPYLDKPLEELWEEHQNPGYYTQTDALVEYLNLSSKEGNPENKKYLYYNFNSLTSIDIEGYNKFHPVQLRYYGAKEAKNGFGFSEDNQTLEFTENGQVLETYNIQFIAGDLHKQYGFNQVYDKPFPVYELSGSLYDVKIAFANIDLEVDNGVWKIRNFDGWAFVKEK